MNTIRPRTAIATVALVAGLSLTACQNDARPGAADPAASGKTANGGSQSTHGGNSGGSSAPGACTNANTKVVVSKVTRPVNHLLLTVTNTGSGTCDAYGAPVLRFDDEQAAVQLVEDSRPQAVVTLAAGGPPTPRSI
ncbi:DUF4232 domain-containing protein [Streptomyces sp. NPDC048434]|uniref:DUF4232 domain-containing protein n=1 Tax=Streptomyces sp. NPDC048434 TaxID=3365549 RepID=UPI003724370D